MVSVIEELRQNNPGRTKIRICLLDERSDADLAAALEQNPFVTDIQVDMDGVQRADWSSLLRVIATRVKLEKVILQDAFIPVQRNAPAGLVRAFLQAIQQNTAIRRLDFQWLRLPTDISMFVNTASSITSFCLYECDMDPAEQQQGARSLAEALQRNTNIESLELSKLGDIYAIPMLEGLRSNVSLKIFIFSPCDIFSDAVSHALQELLESMTSVRRFELSGSTCRGDTFGPIAQAINGSECISELSFSWCEFPERNSGVQLQSILQNKQNLSSLCLHHCDFGGGPVHGDIISILLRPDSLLRCFEFQSSHPLEGAFPGVQFKNLLRAIEKSKLERFRIGYIETAQQLQTLTRSIPSMKLKEMEVFFRHIEGSDLEDEEGGFDQENISQDLLHAVKNNFSLRSLKGKLSFPFGEDRNLFESIEDKQTLAFYANRNRCLDLWVDNPERVEQRKVWPEALGLAQRAGPDALFRGLRLVLESEEYVISKGRRKRKRPQYYAPS